MKQKKILVYADWVELEKPIFRLFLDSSPDSWGLVFMKRRKTILAKIENREIYEPEIAQTPMKKLDKIYINDSPINLYFYLCGITQPLKMHTTFELSHYTHC